MKLFSLVWLLLSTAIIAADIKVNLSGRNFIVGETAVLTLTSYDQPLDSPPKHISSSNVVANFTGTSAAFGTGQRKEFKYHYRITALEPGHYAIPQLELMAGRKTTKTPSVKFHVHPLSKLQKHVHNGPNQKFTYYSFMVLPKTTMMQNEAVPVELKYYLPTKVRVRQWDIPKITATNCAMWRFSFPQSSDNISEAVLESVRYQVASYRSVLHGIAPGTAKLGPLEPTVVTRVQYMHNGFFHGKAVRINLQSQVIPLTVVAFPEDGKPSNFKGDVGNFSMNMNVGTLKPSYSQSDSISVDITLSGKGNFQHINAPTILNKEHWELLNVSRKERGEERRSMLGETTFTYLLSPKPTATQTPQFTFSFFDPDQKCYQTVKSQTLPIKVSASSAPTSNPTTPVAAPQPNTPQKANPTVEEMQDVLAFTETIRPKQSTLFANLPNWWWHCIPAALILAILYTWGSRKYRSYLLANTERLLKKKGLKELSGFSGTKASFYKAAGAFIERWLPTSQDSAVTKILEERDTTCFQPNNVESNEPVPAQKKSEIIAALKKVALTITLLCAFAPQLEAQDYSKAIEAQKSGNYQEALNQYVLTMGSPEDYKNLPADALYNMGNCHYKLGDAGTAALFYHRALVADPTHAEAQQNLRFFAKLYQPTLANEPSKLQKTLSYFRKHTYKNILIGCIWVIAISLLYILLIKPRQALLAAILTPIIAMCVLICAVVALLRYPASIHYAPLNELAVVTKAEQLLHTAPVTPVAGDKTEISELNVTTLCKVIATRGDWRYIQLPNNTRGWVKKDAIVELSTINS